MKNELDIQIESLIEEIQNRCVEWGVTFTIEDNEDEKVLYDEATRCSGFYMNGPKILKVAKKSNHHEFLGLLAHEYCHAVQFNTMKDHPIIRTYRRSKIHWFDEYLNGKRSKEDAATVLPQIVAIEFQCERMVVELLEKYGIEIPEYVREANIYLLSHKMMLEKGAFIETLKVEGREEIPNHFLVDYNTNQYDHVIERCFKA